MGHIYYIMGKSASGKDSVFRVLAADPELGLRTVVMYTTRPMREGEQDGREYFFRNEEFLAAKQAEGTVIESRTYETVCGLWSYFTLDDGQIDLENHRYLMIGTPESYLATKKYFERQKKTPLSPLYIHVEDGERLIRAIGRERLQKHPNYAEICRRFLADEKDFAQEVLDSCGIENIYENRVLEECIREIKKKITEGGCDSRPGVKCNCYSGFRTNLLGSEFKL